jgi:hypothetical protein
MEASVGKLGSSGLVPTPGGKLSWKVVYHNLANP